MLSHAYKSLVLWCLSPKRQSGADTLRFSLNVITTQKMAERLSGDHTVKSSLHLILRPKKGQFAKYCQTPLNHYFQLVSWCLLSEQHFGAVTVKFSLNPITTQKKAKIRNGVRRLQMIVFSESYGDYQHNILEPLQWNSHLIPLWPKWWPIFQNCHTPLKHRFKLFLCYLSLEPQFGAVTVKFSHNGMTTQKMEKLQNGVRRLQIIVFKCSYDAY